MRLRSLWKPRWPHASPARTSSAARRSSSIWSYRSLIWNFAQRDLKSRYKGTALGWLWSLVVPLATLLTYTLVFSVIFRMAPPDFGNGQAGIFPIWLFGGLVVWGYLAQSITMSESAMLGSGSLLQKVYFPSHAPVFGAMAAILVQTVIEVAIYGVLLGLLSNVGASWLLIPVWLAIFVVFVASCALCLAVLNVYYRDVLHLTGVALQLIFFLTPIIYTIDAVPADWNGIPLQQIIMLNPMAQFVESFRLLSYGLEVPSATSWFGLVVWTGLALAVATIVYRRLGLDVGEAI